MKNDKRRPLLIRGEEYITPYKKDNKIPKKDTRPSFDDARTRISNEINNIIKEIDSTPKEFVLDEFIINIKMNVDYSAKSYYPSALISTIEAKSVGSKKWTKEIEYKKNKKISKKNKIGSEIFLKLNKNKLNELKIMLDQGSDGFTKGAIDNIRSIDKLYYDTHSDIISKFSSEWKKGRVELVLHPFDEDTNTVKEKLLNLIKEYGGDVSKVKFKTYKSGVTFVSALLTKKTLERIIRYNPIRTAHPIILKELPQIRSLNIEKNLPDLPTENSESDIKVGVFDGGIDSDNPYLKPFAKEYNPIKTSKDVGFLSHGTGVVGSILYGDLSNHRLDKSLPIPIVNVESFRVFPLSDEMDMDLYEVIDIIEDIVPKRPDIQVYNLSIGPYGAIDDDNISRFTYAIDELSKCGDKLFVVAVGNDGDLESDLARVQAPSDSVNGIGVGSYSNSSRGEIIRANYSCYGDGREGCKIKPDLLEFGGSEENPFEIISIDGLNKNFTAGTSFSSPLIAAKAAEIIGRFNLANPLLARTLLIHTADHPNKKADKYMGHGIAKNNTDDILLCSANSITTIYQSRLRPTQSIKLPIPFLNDLDYDGKVEIKWTIAIATEVDARNTEDYTLTCIEDTFYPNANKYKLTKQQEGKNPKTKSVDISKDVELINEYQSLGWKLSKNPNTYSAFSNAYKTEEQRKQNFKWDTVVKRKTKKMMFNSLKEPYLILHAMSRHSCESEFVNFAVTVTINYLDIEKKQVKEDIYDLTLKSYNKLDIANIRAINEILIK
ncbi:S8 family peptidase [Paraclostridium bifermentans]|uniref:S8 family peptidase n=1 Tax=Paraclostridium TaxID=1849822 RepID=UPI001CC62648|nr:MULTISPECIES: S8 family peptidase [Paraclostridium]MBZ6007283.1 S8 family peptidase [Paraclostridium bifermentans]MDU0297449.1 S8 family peptidase [Paraclostridium sp. MRS3W1]